MTHTEAFARRMQQLRKDKGMSLREFAQYLTQMTGINWDHMAIARYESNEGARPRANKMAALAKFYGKPEAWFFSTDEEYQTRSGNVGLEPAMSESVEEYARWLNEIVGVGKDLTPMDRAYLLGIAMDLKRQRDSIRTRIVQTDNAIQSTSENGKKY